MAGLRFNSNSHNATIIIIMVIEQKSFRNCSKISQNILNHNKLSINISKFKNQHYKSIYYIRRIVLVVMLVERSMINSKQYIN